VLRGLGDVCWPKDLDKPLLRTTGARWWKSAMGRSACLLTHGMLRGGTSDGSLGKLTRITYSPQATANKKPALGGLEKAQGLHSFMKPTSDSSPAMMPSSHSGLIATVVTAAGAAQTVNVVVMSVVPLLKVCDQPVVPSQ
jgi:hypothetical protein